MKKLICFTLALAGALSKQAVAQCNWQVPSTDEINAPAHNFTNVAVSPASTVFMSYADGSLSDHLTVTSYIGGGVLKQMGTAGFTSQAMPYGPIASDPSGTAWIAIQDPANGNKLSVMKFNGSAWVYVGTPGFSSVKAYNPDIAIDNNGTAYVAYRDFAGTGKATVMKYNGSAWVLVGAANFTNTITSSIGLTIDPKTGTPYLIYNDHSKSDKASVMKFNGSAWASLGTAGFSIGSVLTPRMTIDTLGVPYVVYQDVGNGDNATVMKFDGSNWVAVGTPGFSAGMVQYTDIAIDRQLNIPYVIYQDEANRNKATCMMYTSGWVSVGPPGFTAGKATFCRMVINTGELYVSYADSSYNGKPTLMGYTCCNWVELSNNGLTAGKAFYTAMKTDATNTPYIAYSDSASTFGGRASLKKLIGTTWTNVGVNGFSTGIASYISLAFESTNSPYLAYSDASNGQKACVMRNNGHGWVNVGLATGFSVGAASYNSIVFDSNDLLYIAFSDAGNANKVSVMKFTGANFVDAASAPGLSVGAAAYTVMAMDKNDNPYLAFSDAGNGGKVTVMKYSSNAWAVVGTAGFSAGQASNLSLAIDASGTPYVFYSDVANGKTPVVMKFNGSNWQSLGAPISASAMDYTSLVIDLSGAPIIVFTGTAHTSYNLMRYNGTGFVNLGTPPTSQSPVQCPSLTTDALGTVYLGYSSDGAYVEDYSCLTTGIPDVSQAGDELSVFPNPSSSDMTIRLNAIEPHTILSLYNQMGQLVENISLTETQTILKRGNLAAGIYFYRIANASRLTGKGKIVFE